MAPKGEKSIGEMISSQVEATLAPINEADARAAEAQEAAQVAASEAQAARADAQVGIQNLTGELSQATEALNAAAARLNSVGEEQPGETETAQQPVAAEDGMDIKRVSIFDRVRDSKTATRVAAVGGMVLAVAAIAYGASKISSGNESASSNTPAQIDPAPASTSPESQNEVNGWEQKELTPNDQNKWLEKGFPNIKKADSAEESREAANKWLGVIKGDQDTFAFVAGELLGEEVDKNTIFDENGNSTDSAEELLKKVQLKLAVSNIGKGSASKDLKNPHNTGLNKNGQVVLAKNSGVGGDTEAIIVETPDGKKMAIMHRCAQPVVEGDRPNTPKGPTDEDTPEKPPKEEVPSKDGERQPDHPGGGGDDSDHAGNGPAGQKPNGEGHVEGEDKPNTPPKKPTPAPLPEATETRPPQAPAQENPIPPVTGPGTPGNGSDQPTPTEDVEIK